jgi:hypothetical protein
MASSSSNLKIAPTCVANNGGLGLFVDCKGYKKGDTLPFVYPGKQVPCATYQALNDFLFELNKKDPKTITKRQHAEHVLTLKKKFGIRITNYSSDEPVNWTAIYDTFAVYVFYTCAQVNTHIYWTAYNAKTGALEKDQQDMFGLYMNEPCAFRYFYNTHDKRNGYGRLQLSRVNVVSEPVIDEKTGLCTLHFVAVEDIEPYDEILFFYGVYASRDYKINLHGIPNLRRPEAGSDLSSDSSEEKDKFFDQIKRYKHEGDLFVKK